MSEKNRVWRLRNRPVGDIDDNVLSFEEEPIPVPGDGEFLFRLNYLSLDPTNRIWMSDMDQYMPPVELDAQMRGVVCGTVVKSKHPDFAEGAIVSGLGAWADYQIGTPQSVNPEQVAGLIPLKANETDCRGVLEGCVRVFADSASTDTRKNDLSYFAVDFPDDTIGNVFEIEQWTTSDMGKNWIRRSITENSEYDNIRPFVPWFTPAGGKPQLLWMTNYKYIHYSDYQTAIKMDIP